MTTSISSEAQKIMEKTNGQMKFHSRCPKLLQRKEKKVNHETFKEWGLCLLKDDQQRNRQNNLYTRCAYILGIFTRISSDYLQKSSR